MKILLVIESGGGSGRHFSDLAVGLAERGHKVSAVYSPLRLETQYLELLQSAPLEAVEAIPMSRDISAQDLTALRDINRLIRRLGPFLMWSTATAPKPVHLSEWHPSRRPLAFTLHMRFERWTLRSRGGSAGSTKP